MTYRQSLVSLCGAGEREIIPLRPERIARQQHITRGQTRVRGGIACVLINRLLEKLRRFRDVFLGALVPKMQALQVKRINFRFRRRAGCCLDS